MVELSKDDSSTIATAVIASIAATNATLAETPIRILLVGLAMLVLPLFQTMIPGVQSNPLAVVQMMWPVPVQKEWQGIFGENNLTVQVIMFFLYLLIETQLYGEDGEKYGDEDETIIKTMMIILPKNMS